MREVINAIAGMTGEMAVCLINIAMVAYPRSMGSHNGIHLLGSQSAVDKKTHKEVSLGMADVYMSEAWLLSVSTDASVCLH